MNEQSMRFRIGVFVLSAMILLAVLIILFGGYPGLFKRHDRYYIIFRNAPGVEDGTPVRRSGVRIGQVYSVKLNDATGDVRVAVNIERPHPLYQGDRPILVHGILSGDTTIDIIPPKADGHPLDLVQLAPGSEIIGGVQADVATLLNQTSEMVPTAQDALNDIRKTLQRYEKMAPLVEETLREYRDLGRTIREVAPEIREVSRAARESIPDLRRTNQEIQVAARNWGRVGERVDILLQTNQDKVIQALDRFTDTIVRVGNVFNDENQRNLQTTLRNVSNASKSLDSLTRNADDLLREGRQTVKRVNDSIGQAEQVMSNLQVATKPLAERSGAVMKNLEESTDKVNRILEDLREALRALTQSDGAIKRFLTDPTLYNNLNEAVIVLTRALPRVDRILKDIEVFADKIARHPESLGVRGAISPSSGLKEAPYSSMVRPIHPNH